MSDAPDDDEELYPPLARRRRLRRRLIVGGLVLLVLLSVCNVLLPSYRIPSGSMAPTLLVDDHVLVNATAYGPLGGEIGRGEVIVFDFPLDPSQQFNKRVIGLPGDEVRMEGRELAIKRPGAADFEVVSLRSLDRDCMSDDGLTPIARKHCAVYEETLDGRTYLVRYRGTREELASGVRRAETWQVPEGHLFVLGDNRNDSLDSRRWMVEQGDMDVPAPFLPVELVKGRMEWIWWPMSRAATVR